MLKKSELEEFRVKLEEKRQEIENQLRSFAEKDAKVKDDWDTKYPNFDSGTGGQSEEEASDEVEAYVNLLPVEHSLELRLRDINLALEKIAKNKYGKCENCGKSIPTARLKAFPAARTCNKCK